VKKSERINKEGSGGFAKKHVCVKWKPLFTRKNHGIVSRARSVWIMYNQLIFGCFVGLHWNTL
jgi:hypothetical protein